MPGPNPLLNHNFFHPDNQTQHSAYILGFITSDGCLKSNSNQLTFGISSKDSEVLKYIRSCLSDSCDFPKLRIIPPQITPNKMVTKCGELCYMTFSSKSIIEDLHKFGLQSRKTGHEKYPLLLRDDLKYHYLRGLIDGDGSVGVYTRIRVKKAVFEPQVRLFSANYQFLFDLRQQLSLLKGFAIGNNTSCYSLQCQKLSTILNLRSAMYDDAIFSLQRKKDRFFSIPEDKAYQIFLEYKTAKEWSYDERCKVDYKTFLYRIKHGWNYERALSHPSDKGSGARGEESPAGVLSDKQAEDIKVRKLNGESATKLAREYNVSTNAIHYCVNKRKINNKERKCS